MALRIALVTTFYPPFNFGGDGIYVQRLARALVALGCEVTVIHDVDGYRMLAPADRREPELPDEDDGVRVVRLASGAGPLSSLLTQQLGIPVLTKGRLQKLLGENFDVIHYHNVSLIGGPAILSCGEALKLYTAHEHWLVCPTHILWRHNREICDRRECFKCQLVHRRPPQLWRYFGNPDKHYEEVDAFIALSQASADNHHRFGFSQPMKVMPSFLPDLPETVRRKSDEGHPNGGRPFVFFAGRLELIKGLQDVIPQFGPDAPADLLIAGSGNYEDTLRELAGTSPKVKFLGRLEPDALNDFYRHATAVVASSRCYEVFPLVVLEAFRMATPILARSLGAYREIIRETGGGALFETPDDILPIIRKWIDDPALQKEQGEKGRTAYEARWSKGPALAAYFSLIRDLADQKQKPDLARQANEILTGLPASGEFERSEKVV